MINIPAEEKQDIRNRSAKPMLYLAIIAMCMIFGALTSAVLVRSGDPGWFPIALPGMFYVSTAMILLSSLTMWFAMYSAKKDNLSGIKAGMALTLILGLGFIVCQFMAYDAMVVQGIHFGGSSSHPAGSFIYAISGAHLMHLAGGIFMLIYVCIKSFKQLYHSKNLLGLQLCSIYWHFLDLLWVYLFAFIYFTHQ